MTDTKHDMGDLVALGEQVVTYTDVLSNQAGLCMDCAKISAITNLIESYAVWNEVENVNDITKHLMKQLGFSLIDIAPEIQ